MHSEEEKNLLEVKPIEGESEDDDGYFHGDGGNVSLLLFLYLLKGVPLGLTAAIPIILQNRNVDYTDQAEFSVSMWPFSMKILWAPIVDVVYSNRLGKRKSWFVPSQILLGLCMLFISINFNEWVGDDENGKERSPNIHVLTVMFLLINFLTATQDIALDGWAITMLKRRNVGYVSTCSAFGQTVGQVIGYEMFILLNSADFSNALLFWLSEPQPTGIISFPGFIFFWAVVFIVAAIAVGIFKKEKRLDNDTLDVSVRHSYRLLWDILKLKPVQWLSIIFLTSEILYAPNTEVSTLKAMENGLPRDTVAFLTLLMVPIQLALLVFVSRRALVPHRQLSFYVSVVPYRLVSVILAVFIVYVTSWFKDGNYPLSYYAFVLLCSGYDQLLSDYLDISGLAFFSRISDPRCGATYMALMATMINLGTSWPSTVTLWLVDVLTWKTCVTDEYEGIETCTTYIDGLYVILLPCILFGLVWWRFAKNTVDYLHSVDDSMWLIDSSKYRQSTEEEHVNKGYDEIQGDTFVRKEEPDERGDNGYHR